LEKLCVLSFDETYVSNRICYEKNNEQFLGSHRCVQIAMVRGNYTLVFMYNTYIILYSFYIKKYNYWLIGLFANWKQPVFYDFDVPMKPELLFKIIHQLYDVGYNVISIVNDMGATNMGLWRDLNISISNVSFLHPVTSKNIYVFADVPHLLKLARNHFIDQ